MLPQCCPSVVQKSRLLTTSSYHSQDEQRGIPILRCPGGRSSPILAMLIPCRFEYTGSSIGCGAWEARNPRPLWGAHVENTGSGSHGVQGQRPQIRPGLTQLGAEVDGQEFTVGVLGLSTGGPVEPSLQECSLPSIQAGDASPVSGCFSEVTLGVSWHPWGHL